MADPVSRGAGSTLREQAYEAILEAIVSGELPAGQKVTERGLASQVGTSPTPAREAMQRLLQEGRLERVGTRTVLVASVLQQSLGEADEIEVELRILTARFAARKATTQQVQELTALLDDADADVQQLLRRFEAGAALDPDATHRVFVAARAFHDGLERIAANPVLDRILEQARAFTPAQRRDAAEHRPPTPSARSRARHAEHRTILAAVAEHDEERAAALMRRHASVAHRAIRRSLG